MTHHLFLGIDFGTSGARSVAIDADGAIAAEGRCDFSLAQPQEWPSLWRSALDDVIIQIPASTRRDIRAIAINGTSGTVLWCDEAGTPLKPPLLYNDNRGQAVLPLVRAIAPAEHVALSATSSFAKWVWWHCGEEGARKGEQKLLEAADSQTARTEALKILEQSSERIAPGYLLHQSDWLAFLLHGRMSVSDYHNSLKLGYDVQQLSYPQWMQGLPTRLQMPRQVLIPGTPIACVTPAIADRLGLAQDCQICAGTTDSIAAFLASGASQPGEAVTSLGSTLVLKLLSETPVNASQYGVYSHRLDAFAKGDRPLWLVGGASNTGGAVLRQFFSDADIERLSHAIDPNEASLLDYYPLLTPGDRFPINDPNLLPRLSPYPETDEAFLHGLLESIARIEAHGYRLLQELGASPLAQVYTAGGGAKNQIWTQIRQRHIGVPVGLSAQPDAAYGTARLARTHFQP